MDKDNGHNQDPFSGKGFSSGFTYSANPTEKNSSSANSSPDNTSGSGTGQQVKINLPAGGGAIRGIGEKFEANPVTGTASFTVPVTLSKGRGGLTPQLALNYDSGSGNSAFGIGWDIGIPSITRKTDKGIPQYNDNPDNESDTFILSGAEDLVAVIDPQTGEREFRTEQGFVIYGYRPRIEGLFALIERWEDRNTKVSHWRTISKDNITSVYGLGIHNNPSFIADPDHKRKVFTWLLEASWDAKGNLMVFQYKREDNVNIPSSCYEQSRTERKHFTNTYLKKVLYGNKKMYRPNTDFSEYDFHFQLVLDYGDIVLRNEELRIGQEGWKCRNDAFSSYKSGFEIRTYRLCERLLMFHHFEELGAEPVLVRSTDLEYKHSETDSFSLLSCVTHKGYKDDIEDSFPPLTLTYSQAVPADHFKTVTSRELQQLPAGIDGQNYQWADLYSEGISGILSMDNQAWYFMPNTGDKLFTGSDPGTESEPTFGSMKSEAPKPAATNNKRTTFILNDVDNDGFPELVIQGDGVNGFYSRDNDGKWQNFRNFEKYPHVDFNDANLRFMDLSGDGLADIVISKGEIFDIYFSEGKKGFGRYRRVRCGKEPGRAPQVVFSDPKQRIFIADMSGDGLSDIVKVTHQSIVYWPNMGYGRFGEKITMGNPPLLDSPDRFDARFVHLTDVDGTGTADLLYISKGQVRYYKNLSGNSWKKEELPSALSVNVSKQTFVQTTDLLGNGTQCIVVTSSLPVQKGQLCYWELTSGIKPFLLTQINNNMGGITRLHYTPSTKFYLQDKMKGAPWVTKLPFPVQVLEKVETLDEVSNTRFVNRYAYHHGYYDAVEREFRGFGMVEQWDTEFYNEFEHNNTGTANNEGYVSPVYTKTWFHTGFFAGRNKIARQYASEYYKGISENPNDESIGTWELPDTLIPEGLKGQEAREACRALKGSALRTEVYALDGTAKEKIPYTVEEKSYHLQCLQAQGDNKHAVFLKTDGEQMMFHYERNTEDPRILHKLVLQTDAYGNIVKSIQVAYPRKGTPELAEQRQMLIIYTENNYINEEKRENNINGHNSIKYRHIGVLYNTKQYEIGNITYSNKKLACPDFNDLISGNATSGITKKIVGHQRTLFWNEALRAPLSNFGEIASHGLVYRQEMLEITPELITFTGVDKYSETRLSEAGYDNQNGGWYKISDIEHYDSTKFYQPDTISDPFGNTTAIEYDGYNLFPVNVTNALRHETTADYNYRVLQPWKITDPNSNIRQLAFDMLGMVVKLALTSRVESEGDSFEDPTEIYEYNLKGWMAENGKKPAYVHIKKRETHADSDTHWIESYVYTDGLGNEIMTKTTAAEGKAFTLVNDQKAEIYTTDRWLASGKIIFNNKGNAIKQYEPWYSTTNEFEDEEQLTSYGVTPVMHYDPLGRLIQTDFPDGTISKVEFNAWQQKNYDQNDCISDKDAHGEKICRWYRERIAISPTETDENLKAMRRSATVSEQHAGTPQVIDLDVLGRPFRTTDDNGDFGDSCVTRNILDIAGRITRVTDGLGREATANVYTLTGEIPVYISNIDSGKRWILNDVTGKPFMKWDARGHEIQYKYDELQRPVETVVNGACVERILYDGVTPNAIGNITEIYAQDGVTGFEYDFKGNIIKQCKQFTDDAGTSAIAFTDMIDWNTTPVPETEAFETKTTFNALNLPVSIAHPDHTVLHYIYDKGGKLYKVEGGSGYIEKIKYNARGQRRYIQYANGTKTRYEYNPLNFRLTRLITFNDSELNAFQDLNYNYDPVGNIIEIRDNAQQTEYVSNQEVAPVMTYTYDALYRLLTATGRELSEISTPSIENIPYYSPQAPGNAVQNYNHTYTYDILGNMLSNPWRTNVYDIDKNRLLKHSNQTVNQYTYDAHGNMLTMPHLSSMNWDYKDQLTGAGNGTFISHYHYDIEGNRTRKIVVKTNKVEKYYYICGFEVIREYANTSAEATVVNEYHTVSVADEEKVFLRMESKINNGQATTVLRYQYDNHLGSACLELSHDGSIISYEEYYPFGQTSYYTSNSSIEVSLKRYKYCGKERDEETGLYYYGMRYYADWLCRFVSVDPLQFEYPELTPFQYASNNPVTMIDLDGLEGVKPQQQNKQQSSDQVQEGLRDGSGSSAKPFVLMNEVVVSASKVEVPASDTNYQNTNIPLNLIPQFASPVDPSGGLGSAYAQRQQISQDPQYQFHQFGEIRAPNNLVRFEMWLDSPSKNIGISIGKIAANIVYSIANSPYSLLTGRTISGRYLNSTEKMDAFIDVIPGLLSAGFTKTGQVIKTSKKGLEGYNQFIKEAKKSGVEFKGLNWQFDAGKKFQINNVNQQGLKSWNNTKNVLDVGRATKNELEK